MKSRAITANMMLNDIVRKAAEVADTFIKSEDHIENIEAQQGLELMCKALRTDPWGSELLYAELEQLDRYERMCELIRLVDLLDEDDEEELMQLLQNTTHDTTD